MTRALERALKQFQKNYIINGGMMVSQENGSTALTAGGYVVDQFLVSATTSGTYTAAQVASLTPGGSPNRLRFTVTAADTSVGAGDLIVIETILEGLRVADLGAGSASAKMITIQFGVKAPAGTYCVSIRNGGATRGYIAQYTISAGEANTDVVKSATIPLDQTGTWPVDNTKSFIIDWQLMTGTNFQGTANTWLSSGIQIATSSQFNIMGTNGNVFELFDVGFYEGATAPVFQLPDYASELALCKRYWAKLLNWVVDAGVQVFSMTLPVPMRVAPTWTGGGSGFSSIGFTDGQTGIISQTTRATQNLVASARM